MRPKKNFFLSFWTNLFLHENKEEINFMLQKKEVLTKICDVIV